MHSVKKSWPDIANCSSTEKINNIGEYKLYSLISVKNMIFVTSKLKTIEILVLQHNAVGKTHGLSYKIAKIGIKAFSCIYIS